MRKLPSAIEESWKAVLRRHQARKMSLSRNLLKLYS